MELFRRTSLRSFSINAENSTGEKGKGGMAASKLGQSRKGSPCLLDIKPGETRVLADIKGSGKITHIWITAPDKTSDTERFVLRDLVLRMYWDGENSPSVEVPLGDFFCSGFGETYKVDSLLISALPLRGYNSYIEMPFRENAVITLENQHNNPIPAFFYQIDYVLGENYEEDILYFHAQWRRENPTIKGNDYTLLDDVKGDGVYIGTFLAISTLSRYWYGEGEFKFYIDGDSLYPTICGTGLEDYFGGSWSLAERDKYNNGETVEETFNSSYVGYPFYSRDDKSYKSGFHNHECPPMRAFYRWHIKDPIYFHKDIRVTVQQIGITNSGLFERSDDISSVSYYYQSEPHVPFKALPPAEDRWPR